MKAKRLTLIIVLIAIFVVCFQSMNNRYDPLARYSYNSELTMQERELIIQHMNTEDIDYMIQAKLKPEQVLKYINVEGFKVKNTLYYERCIELQPTDLKFIVDFVNTYRKELSYKKMESLLTSYSYTTLMEFYNGAYTYKKDVNLITNPQKMHTMIKSNNTLYKYEPKGLVTIDNSIIPIASVLSTETLQMKEEVLEPLKMMCAALEKTNNLTCGGLILTTAYTSYSDQIKLYEQALVRYGIDLVANYEDVPGQSEHQLGYTLKFTIAGKNEEEIKASEQVKWLEEHAQEYGFIIRYPKNEEGKTGKFYQPLTLRYIGSDIMDEGFNFVEFLSGD